MRIIRHMSIVKSIVEGCFRSFPIDNVPRVTIYYERTRMQGKYSFHKFYYVCVLFNYGLNRKKYDTKYKCNHE